MARFLHLSDLHAVAPGQLASGVLNTPRLLESAIDTLLERMKAIGPFDGVLITGDISEDGSPASYEFARTQLERLSLPLLPIPGNHDDRENMRTAFADLALLQTDDAMDWTANFGDTQVIGLDTLIEGKGAGRLEDKSLTHLEEALASSDAEYRIVALHHPPLETGIRFMDRIGLENTDALRTILKAANQEILVVAGHVHGVYHAMLAGHPVVTGPSLCSAFAFDRREGAPVGFFEGPCGCALIDTSHAIRWTIIPLDHGAGPHAF